AYLLHEKMLLQTILKISTFVFLSSRQFCQVNGQCVDQAGVITNGKTCAQLLASDCYDATFLNNCCQTCKTFYTGVTGCEYGDKVANCVVSLCEYYSNPSECCVTCKVTTTAAPTTSTSATSTIPTLATTTKTPISTTPPTLAAITPTTSFIATTTQPTITTTPKVTLGATTATISKTIATVTAYTSTTSSLQVPMAPSVSIISQTTHTITLNVTLQAGSTVNQFEITASTGVVQKIPLPAGNVSVKYVFNVPNDSGTCFTLDIVATNAAGTSPVTTLSDACYAPLPPSVVIVTQTTTNITLNMTVPQGSLGNTFEVLITRAGTNLSVPLSLGGSRSIQYVLDTAVEAGSCFRLEVITIVTNNPIKSQATIFSDVCYAPKKPEVTVVTQTTSNVTLTVTLPAGSLGNTFKVIAIGGGSIQYSIIAMRGFRSIQHVVDIVTEAGTCFIIEAVTLVINNSIASDKTTLSNVCYAPKKPDIIVITQTISSVILNITLPTFSLGNTIEIKVTGGGAFRSVPLTTGVSRSVQHVFNEAADAGTCFSLEFLIVVTTNPIKSDTTTITNACYAPKKPDIIVITQTISSVILNITLPTFSLGNTIEIKVTGGGAFRSVPLTTGVSRSVQHVFNEAAEAGTCFSLEFLIVVTTNPIKSDTTTITNACYAPLPPSVVIVTQTTTNITLNMTVPQGSLGNTFEVLITRAGTNLSVPLSLGGSRSIQYVLDTAVEAGSCFRLEVITIVTNNPIKSQATIFSDVCYAPKKPEITVVTQTTSNVTLTVTLPAGSLGNTFKVIAIGGGSIQYSIIAMRGFRSIQHVVDIVTEAGTCFIIEAVTLDINNSIASDKTTLSNVCYAPKKPDIIVITQTISSVILNITLPTFSLGNTIEIKVTGGGAFRSVPLTTGVSRSVQHVFNEAADAGTCFSLEFLIVVTTNPIKSDTTTITNACYAPSKPEVNVVAQTTMNITMTITLPTESLGSSFEVRVIGGVASRTVPLIDDGSRSVQHVFNEVAKAGTCFSIEIFTLVSSNPIKSDTTVTSSCYVPLKPYGSVFEQAMDYIIFNMALQAGSTGKSFNVKVTDGKEYDLGIPEGSTDVQFAFNETGIPGTCFTLQVKTLSFGNVTESEASTIPNTCYAPKRPEVNVVETTITNIKLNISVASDSFAKSFQIRRTGETAMTVDFPSGNAPAFYLFDSPGKAGTCFTFEIVAIAADDRARSSVFVINNTCYEKMIVAVSSVGGLICVCGAAAVLCTIAMKMKKAQQNKKYSPPRHHKNHRLRSHRYGSHRKIPDYFGTYYPTHAHYYNHQIYNLDPRTNNGNIQDYMTSQVYN
ncbi:hypothetical protein ACJMK2_015073, partial [Sinanodonta woodiana]